jgi:hypothetical protein
MKWIIIVAIAIAAASALPEKLGQARGARRGRQRQRASRQESPDNLYAAPGDTGADSAYGAPVAAADEVSEYDTLPAQDDYENEEYDNAQAGSEDLGTSYGAPVGEEESSGEGLAPPAEYGASDDQSQYNTDQDAQPSDVSEVGDDAEADPLDMLMKSIPGIPGEDYPIFAEAPETAFSCDGQVNGGYYADPEAQCQAFHICSQNGEGGLSKYTFLCPNGTIFNQEYFICDWWFNVDCDQAEALAESRNGELEAARDEADARLAEEKLSAEESAPIPAYDDEEPQSTYGASLDEAGSESLPSYAEQPSYSSRRRF